MYVNYVLLFEDARQCLQMGFEPINHHCLNTYRSALTWIPKGSLIRQQYVTSFDSGPRVVIGLTDTWGLEAEHVMRHAGAVRSVTFSPDGSRVVSGSSDHSISIWDMATGEVERVLDGHSGWVRSVAISPDGKWIVSGSGDKSVRVWNASSGDVERIYEGDSDTVCSVTFSPDGTRVISGSRDRTVRIWDTNTGEIERIVKGHLGAVNCVASSPDGRHILSGSDDNSVRIWNVLTGVTEHILQGHSGEVWCVAFSPDGKRVVSGSLLWITQSIFGMRVQERWIEYCRRDLSCFVLHSLPTGHMWFLALLSQSGYGMQLPEILSVYWKDIRITLGRLHSRLMEHGLFLCRLTTQPGSGM